MIGFVLGQAIALVGFIIARELIAPWIAKRRAERKAEKRRHSFIDAARKARANE